MQIHFIFFHFSKSEVKVRLIHFCDYSTYRGT